MKKYKNVRVTAEYHQRLQTLADTEKRKMISVIERLIDQEYARLYSQPNELVTIREAIEAAQHAEAVK